MSISVRRSRASLFTLILFDHARTRFPLAGKRRPLACGACHPAEALRDGSTAIRWRLGYQQCKDCHGNPHREGR
jgi:hypothetical protein